MTRNGSSERGERSVASSLHFSAIIGHVATASQAVREVTNGAPIPFVAFGLIYVDALMSKKGSANALCGGLVNEVRCLLLMGDDHCVVAGGVLHIDDAAVLRLGDTVAGEPLEIAHEVLVNLHIGLLNDGAADHNLKRIFGE